MKQENVLHGWRNPNENPETDATLLVVYRDNKDNVVFTTTEYLGIGHARKQKDFTLLAWQYLPVWVED